MALGLGNEARGFRVVKVEMERAGVLIDARSPRGDKGSKGVARAGTCPYIAICEGGGGYPTGHEIWATSLFLFCPQSRDQLLQDAGEHLTLRWMFSQQIVINR